VISDAWPGLETFFASGSEILLARSTAECVAYLHDLPEAERRRIGRGARARVLSSHTAAHRAAELESYALDLLAPSSRRSAGAASRAAGAPEATRARLGPAT
jgi:spore maturation protein CgeB